MQPIAGLPVTLNQDQNNYYISATFQNVRFQGSPLVVTFDPPVATIEEVSVPKLVDGLAAAIANGATILPF